MVKPSAGPPPPASASSPAAWLQPLLLLPLLLRRLPSAPLPAGWWTPLPSRTLRAAEPAAAEPSSEHFLPRAAGGGESQLT